MRLVVHVPAESLWRALAGCCGVCLVDGWPCFIAQLTPSFRRNEKDATFALLRWINYEEKTEHTLYLSEASIKRCTLENACVLLTVENEPRPFPIVFLKQADPENALRGALNRDFWTLRPVCIHGIN